MIFSLLGALIVNLQLSKFEDPIERPNLAWNIFYISVFGVTPIIAILGNFFRWRWYHRWITNSGLITAHVTEMGRVPQPDQEYEVEYEDEDICACEYEADNKFCSYRKV